MYRFTTYRPDRNSGVTLELCREALSLHSHYSTFLLPTYTPYFSKFKGLVRVALKCVDLRMHGVPHILGEFEELESWREYWSRLRCENLRKILMKHETSRVWLVWLYEDETRLWSDPKRLAVSRRRTNRREWMAQHMLVFIRQCL